MEEGSQKRKWLWCKVFANKPEIAWPLQLLSGFSSFCGSCLAGFHFLFAELNRASLRAGEPVLTLVVLMTKWPLDPLETCRDRELFFMCWSPPWPSLMRPEMVCTEGAKGLFSEAQDWSSGVCRRALGPSTGVWCQGLPSTDPVLALQPVLSVPGSTRLPCPPGGMVPE